MKIIPVLILAGFAAMHCMQAYAENVSGWYIGASYGRSKSGLNQDDVDALTGGGITIPALRTLSGSSAAYKLYGGFRVNPNISLEGGYADMGKANFNSGMRFARCFNLPINCISPDAPIRVVRITHGMQFSVVGSLPIDNQFALIGQLGFMRSEVTLQTYWDFTNSSVQPIVPIAPEISTVTVLRTTPSIGIGGRYTFTPQVSARLNWEQFRNIGDSAKTGAHDVNMVSLGLEYHF